MNDPGYNVAYNKLLLLKDAKGVIDRLTRVKNKLQDNIDVAAREETDLPLYKKELMALRREKKAYLNYVKAVEGNMGVMTRVVKDSVRLRKTALDNAKKLQKVVKALEHQIEEYKKELGYNEPVSQVYGQDDEMTNDSSRLFLGPSSSHTDVRCIVEKPEDNPCSSSTQRTSSEPEIHQDIRDLNCDSSWPHWKKRQK